MDMVANQDPAFSNHLDPPNPSQRGSDVGHDGLNRPGFQLKDGVEAVLGVSGEAGKRRTVHLNYLCPAQKAEEVKAVNPGV